MADFKKLETTEEVDYQKVCITSKIVLSFKEAQEYSGMSGSYLYKLTSRQQIPHYKPSGKLIYFKREELEAWLLQNRVNTIEEISNKAKVECLKKGRR